MAKRTSGFTKGLEQWNVRGNQTILKIVVRNERGQLHGSTNFRANPKTTTAR